MAERIKKYDTCKIDMRSLSSIKSRLPEIAEDIIGSCSDRECYTHVDYEPIPSKDGVIDIINRLREILFPGYFTGMVLSAESFEYHLGQNVSTFYENLAIDNIEVIHRGIEPGRGLLGSLRTLRGLQEAGGSEKPGGESLK